MGSEMSKDTLHCNQYLPGQGPPSLSQQEARFNGTIKPLTRSQPEGQMTWVILHRDLPGYPQDNTVQMSYVFPDGIQMEKHPHPGQKFGGQRMWAYLPDNREGRKVLRLLDKAFKQNILFTIATNQEGEDVITATDIPLKTLPDSGTKTDSYPDPDYLKNAKKILKDKGIE